VATDPPGDLVLRPLNGEERTLHEWLTNFNLALFVIDPFTNESSWILDTAVRIMRVFSGTSARTSWLVTGEPDDAREFLGELANEFLTFADPDRTVVKALGLQRLPAFVAVRADGTVAASAEGWHPNQWKAVADELARMNAWSRPELPHPSDPVPFEGSPALT
jgi:hypothetical protein